LTARPTDEGGPALDTSRRLDGQQRAGDYPSTHFWWRRWTRAVALAQVDPEAVPVPDTWFDVARILDELSQ